MTSPKYSRPGGNPNYPHSHDSGSGYTRGGGLFAGCPLVGLLLLGLVACGVYVAAQVLQFAASSLAGAL